VANPLHFDRWHASFTGFLDALLSPRGWAEAIPADGPAAHRAEALLGLAHRLGVSGDLDPRDALEVTFASLVPASRDRMVEFCLTRLWPAIEQALAQGGNSALHPAIHPRSLPEGCVVALGDRTQPESLLAAARFALIPAAHPVRSLISEADCPAFDDPREGRFLVLGRARRIDPPWSGGPAEWGGPPGSTPCAPSS
jgi:hypothetical protein